MKFGWCLKGVMHGDQERRLPDCLKHLQRRVEVLAIIIDYSKAKSIDDKVPAAPSLCALWSSSSAQCLPFSTPAGKLRCCYEAGQMLLLSDSDLHSIEVSTIRTTNLPHKENFPICCKYQHYFSNHSHLHARQSKHIK